MLDVRAPQQTTFKTENQQHTRLRLVPTKHAVDIFRSQL